jgi:hypothetical protein
MTVTSTFNIADKVRVVYPFEHTYGEVYEVTDLIVEDGVVVAYELNGNGCFDAQYLQQA